MASEYFDSIRPKLDKTTVINEIKMQLSVPNNKKKSFILVEGQNDISVLDTLFDNENTILYESYGGKREIVKMVTEVFLDEKQVFGIVDKDFDLNEEQLQLFNYDFCNLEMMIVGNNDAFNALIFKLTNIKMDYLEFRKKVLFDLIVLTAVRKANYMYDWGINFSKLPITCFLKFNNVDRRYVYESIKRNHEFDKEKEEICNNIIESLKNEELLNFTNGHDFCEALSISLKSCFSENKSIKSLGKRNMFNLLSCVFGPHYFKQTELYAKLKKYQVENELSLIMY